MEATMSELVSIGSECKDPQSLFSEYNQRYFGGRLPPYKVLPTTCVSRCEWSKRKIYISPSKEDVSVILLHEMVHAAVGRGHGRVFRDELRRLVELGAPLQEELERFAPENQITLTQLLAEFFEAGLNAPDDWTWPEVRRHMGCMWGITDKNGRAKSRRLSHFLRRARREWSRGRALAIA